MVCDGVWWCVMVCDSWCHNKWYVIYIYIYICKIPLYIIIYHYISLYIIIYHYMSLYVIICHYISLYIIIYHYISLYIIIYHYISLHIITYHYISLYIIILYIIIYISLWRGCLPKFNWWFICFRLSSGVISGWFRVDFGLLRVLISGSNHCKLWIKTWLKTCVR